MKELVAIYVFTIIILSCNIAKKKNTIQNDPKLESEKFSIFFNHFRTDSVFQISRRDDPLNVIYIDSEGSESKFLKINYVSFDQKDWKEKISYSINEIKADTVMVKLEADDTGILIEHFFAIRNQRWHLFKIINKSD